MSPRVLFPSHKPGWQFLHGFDRFLISIPAKQGEWGREFPSSNVSHEKEIGSRCLTNLTRTMKSFVIGMVKKTVRGGLLLKGDYTSPF